MPKRGITLSEFIVSIAILALISVFLAQFYVLMGRVYDEVSVHSEMQRALRQIASTWLFSELREASPAASTTKAILMPTGTQTTAGEVRFTRPTNMNSPRSTGYETVRYYYNQNNRTFYREIVGSGYSRKIAENIAQLTFTWINDYTIRINLVITKSIGQRAVSASAEAYITTRYTP